MICLAARVVLGAKPWNNEDVALSDDEQRILRQIEEQLKGDQRFAQAVSSSGLYRHSVKTIRWAALGMVAGLVILIAALSVHFILAFVGFLIMLGCALAIQRQVRAMSKVGLADMTATFRGARAGASRLKDKFSRDI